MPAGVVAIALVKPLIAGQFAPEIVAGAVVYLVFASAFGWVMFIHPAKDPSSER